MSKSLGSKMVTATKWSAITEIAAKLVTPITSMVLARLITPEAYGIVATLNMVIVFAEIFTDAGFQKYIIQHEFEDDQDRDESTNVAFWSNLVLSFLLWGLIAIFANPIMKLVGNPGYGNVLIIACVSIPVAAFSSIQMANYKRDLDFKTLFKIRMIGIVVPLVVTIPAAIYFRNFWALVIGNIATHTINAIFLTWFSSWKPRFFYSFKKFKEMFSFTFWSMLESLSGWLVNYFDVFIIGSMLSQYYLGLYKTSSSLVTQFMSLITATTSSVLFSSLSRLQNDRKEFDRIFLKFQKLVGVLVVPLGVGMFCYSDLLTSIMLGDKWAEASNVVGLWGLVSGLMIVMNHYCGHLYRALGKPKLSTLSEWLHIAFLWPIVIIAAKHGFEALYITRTLGRLQHVIVDMCLMSFVIHFSVKKIFANIAPSVVASVLMAGVAFLLKTVSASVIWQLASILICIIAYCAFLLIFPEERAILLNTWNKFLNRISLIRRS